ncbi:MAG: type II secretion system protein GspN [Nannocystaceae bacterium]|nr:type II secretion system protein GspN [Nannocystaceae bacterium]
MKLTVKLPNFSMTRGKIPDVGGANNAARLKMRRRLRSIFLWGSLGVFFFVTFAWLSLPTRAIAWRIQHEAKKAGFVITIDDIGLRPWGTVILKDVAWTYSPSRPGEVPGKFFIPRVSIDIGLLSLLAGDLSVELEAELDEGVIRAEYEKSSDVSRYSFEIEDVPLYGLPKAQQSLNAPLRGIFAVKGEIELPDHEFKKSTGFVEITCASCVVGDGETKLFVPGSKGALANGLTIPEVDLGTLTGRMTIDKGVAKTDGPIVTESDDVWVHIEGEIELNDPFGKSRFDMLLKFNLSEQLQNRSEPMKLMIQTASTKTKLEDPEHGLGFNLRGPLSAPRFYGHKTKSRRQSRAEKRDSYKKRAEKRRQRKNKKNSKKKKKKKPSKDADSGKSKDDGKDDSKDDGLDVKPIEPAKPALPIPAVEDPAEEPPEAPPAEEPVEEPVEEPGEEPTGGAAVEEPAAGGDEVIIDEGDDEGAQGQADDGAVVTGGVAVEE